MSLKEVKSKQLQDLVKKSKNGVFIWIGVLVFSILIFILGFYFNENTGDNYQNFNDILTSEYPSENTYAKLDVHDNAYGFAYYENDTSGKFYFVYDEKYMYIAFLSKKQANELKADDIKNKPVIITGKTKKIPSDIKKLALEAYNESVSEEYKITSTEFASYFGTLYLDTTELSWTTTLVYVIGMIGFISGLVGLLCSIFYRFKIKRHMKKLSEEEWELINQQLDQEESFYYKNAKLSLTKDYIIDLASGIRVIPYKDIIWCYRFETRYNGVKTALSLILYTKDKKRVVLARLSGLSKASKETLTEIMNTIHEKNNSAVLGYNAETRKQMKEEYQIKA